MIVLEDARFVIVQLMKQQVKEISIFVAQDVGLNIGESTMTKNEFDNEYNYQEIKRVLKLMLNERLISKDEYNELYSLEKQKYNPIFDIIT